MCPPFSKGSASDGLEHRLRPRPALVGHRRAGLALAVAARTRGFPCTVVMPNDAPRPKREAVEQAGATIVPCEPTMSARETTLAELVARTGACVVPPFDHPDVIEGQGTIGLEILEEWPEVDVVMAPIGGGGMIGGIAVAAKGRKPSVAVLAAEPAAADDAARSMASGVRQAPTNAPTLADGLRAGIGAITFPIVRERVDRVFTVSEADIVTWMRFAFERLKLVIEPSAAVGVAAVRASGWRRAASSNVSGERRNARSVALMKPAAPSVCGSARAARTAWSTMVAG